MKSGISAIGHAIEKILQGKSILIIDDEEKIRSLLSNYLLLAAIDENLIVHACDGVEGLRKIQNQDFGLIIIDIVLPRKNGLELYKEIRSRARTRNIPTMFISGNLSSGIVKRAILMGAKHIIAKPFKYDVFLERLSRCLEVEGPQY